MSSLLLGLEGSITHAHLVRAAYEWVLKRGSCGVAFREFRTYNAEFPDVIGFGSDLSVVVECKVSRADYLADAKKPFRLRPESGMGKRRYYCVPEGLIKASELPTGWGLIYVDNDLKPRLQFKPMCEKTNDTGNSYRAHYEFEYNIKAEHKLMYSALRRLHIRGRIEEVYTDAAEALKQQNNQQ